MGLRKEKFKKFKKLFEETANVQAIIEGYYYDEELDDEVKFDISQYPELENKFIKSSNVYHGYTAEYIYYFIKFDLYVKFSGYYDSYSTVRYDEYDITLVEPIEKTITVYEEVK